MAVKKKSKSSKKPKWHFDDHPLVAKLRAAERTAAGRAVPPDIALAQ